MNIEVNNNNTHVESIEVVVVIVVVVEVVEVVVVVVVVVEVVVVVVVVVMIFIFFILLLSRIVQGCFPDYQECVYGRLIQHWTNGYNCADTDAGSCGDPPAPGY